MCNIFISKQVHKTTRGESPPSTPDISLASPELHSSSPLSNPPDSNSDSRASSPLSDVPTNFEMSMEDFLAKDDQVEEVSKHSSTSYERMEDYVIPFMKFSPFVRQRIYHFLGYPVLYKDSVLLLRGKSQLELRERYKVNYCRGAVISQPWNYGHGASGESDGRAKHINPQFFVPLLLTNKEIKSELYELLYAYSMFEVTLVGWRYVTQSGNFLEECHC
jgi:hypothetical protein